MPIGAKDNVRWVDGLRGIASITVVITHLARAFDHDLFSPNSGENMYPRLLQMPFIRVFVHGRIGVAIFSLVTGYVCALKPIKLAKASKYEDALVAVAKSAFRRVPRLILPTTLITAIIWLICQFGAFQAARRSDSSWLRATSPHITPFIGDALFDLMNQCIRTWVYSQNNYDPNQWTMHSLLKGSMLVYIMICATLYVQPKYRMMLCMGMYVFYWVGQEAVFGMQFFFGMFMADLQSLPQSPAPLSPPGRLKRLFMSLRAPILIFLGFCLASYPENDAERAGWSAAMKEVATWILRDGYDKARYYSAWGLELIVLGIHFSPRAKDILSNRWFIWLGKNSFAVYLIHGTIIRTFLTWVIYGFRMPPDEQHEDGTMSPGFLHQGHQSAKWFWFPIFFVLLYTIAHFWTTKVDPLCADWSKAIEKYMFKDESAGLLANTAQIQAVSKREDTEQEKKNPETLVVPLTEIR